MTFKTMKALLGGTVLAATASTFALAQDAALQSDMNLTVEPPQAEIKTEKSTEADVKADQIDPETEAEIKSAVTFDENESVMGAVEFDEETRMNSAPEADLTYEKEADIGVEADLPEVELETPETEIEIESEVESEVDTPE